jgi:hypothetical protein
MSPPYDDSLRLKKRQTSEISFLLVLINREQQPVLLDANSPAPDYASRSVTLQPIENDHIRDSLSFILAADGVVRCQRDTEYIREQYGIPDSEPRYQYSLAALEEISRLEMLMAED